MNKQNLSDYRLELLRDLHAQSEELGSFAEELFLEEALRVMQDAGISAEYDVARCDQTVGNSKLRINAYGIETPDAEESDSFSSFVAEPEIRLFVCDFNGEDELSVIRTEEITSLARSAINFFTQSIKDPDKIDSDHYPEAYLCALSISAVKQQHDKLNLRVFVISDRQASERYSVKERDFDHGRVFIEVFDIRQLQAHTESEGAQPEISLNFRELVGAGIPALMVPSATEDDGYDYGLAAIPAKALVSLFNSYKQRLLESNVRHHLGSTGRVNRGIAETAKNQPERFMAFNNGVVIVAKDWRFERNESGHILLTEIISPQIVNGGQTTVTLYQIARDNVGLDAVWVPAKVIVPRYESADKRSELISKIAEYSNKQNAIKSSDLTSGHKVHAQFETLANSTPLRDGKSRWFYERANGGYNAFIDQNSGSTTTSRKKLRNEIPKSRVVTKTEMAKALTVWGFKSLRPNPSRATLGGEKNLTAFMTELNELYATSGANGVSEEDFFKELISKEDFKASIAKHIILKATCQKVKNLKVSPNPTSTANYVLALISTHHGDSIDFIDIWNKQGLSPKLERLIDEYITLVAKALAEYVGNKNYNEVCKTRGAFVEVLKQVPKLSF